jgi:hypothetical protein
VAKQERLMRNLSRDLVVVEEGLVGLTFQEGAVVEVEVR